MLNITSETFEETVLHSQKPVLVDFFAAWCGPCKAMHPVLEELDGEPDFVVGQIDIDAEPELAARYHVMSVPYFAVFRDGALTGKSVGVQSKEDLLALLKK